MTVSEQFLTYQLSVKMSELGFDLPCLAKWSDKEKLILLDKPAINIKTFPICAPLWQQAFEWITEKYKLEIQIHKYKEDSYFISLNNVYIVDDLDFKLKYTKSEVKNTALEICFKHIQQKNK